MDISLSSLIQLKRLVPSMAHSLFSLMKRYFKSLMIHSNLNCGNVYYSKKIKDWRITEWQEYNNSESKLDNSLKVIYDFENDFFDLYNKIKHYTGYELENTQISLNLKTRIKELVKEFDLKLN